MSTEMSTGDEPAPTGFVPYDYSGRVDPAALIVDGRDPLADAHQTACTLAARLADAIGERDAGETLAQRLYQAEFDLRRRDDVIAELRKHIAGRDGTIDRLQSAAGTRAFPALVSAGADALQQHIMTGVNQSYEDMAAAVLRGIRDLGAITWTEAGQ